MAVFLPNCSQCPFGVVRKGVGIERGSLPLADVESFERDNQAELSPR